MAKIGLSERYGRKHSPRIIIKMCVRRHFTDPVRRMRLPSLSIARILGIFAESPGGLFQGVTGRGPVPGFEVEEARFGVQPRLFLRRKKRFIRRMPVHIGKGILAELNRISDGSPSGGSDPDQQKKQERRQQADCDAFLFAMFHQTG